MDAGTQSQEIIPVKTIHLVQLAAQALLIAAASASVPQAATAQTPDMSSDIVITAPRSVPLPVERNTYTGAPIIVTTVKIPVLYYDLDLKDPASAPRLMKRIERVAQDACTQLDRLYPLNPDAECIGKAVANAAPAAKAAIALAAR
jgi:UrcA family protein